MSNNSYPAAFPHDSIEELFENVYWVHGSVKMGPGMRINRNMVILKNGEELILVNPIRLSAKEEKNLSSLGTIKKIIRLGEFHGLDDQYYVDTFNAEFWCQEGQQTYQKPTPDKLIVEGLSPPVDNTEFFLFSGAIKPEAALLIRDHKLLITADAIQNLSAGNYTTPLAKIVMKLLGFKRELIIGKIWLKKFTPKGGSLRDDFERLLKLDFEHIIAAHGVLMRGDAKTKLTNIVAETFE